MLAILLAIRLLISAIFAVSGIAKLFDPVGSFNALTGFRVPPWLAKPSSRLLPIAELIVSIAIIPLASGALGAWGALGLCLLFSVAILFALARGEKPDCHCFGQLHSEPVGPATLVRSLVLSALSVMVIWFGPGASAGGWIDQLNAAEIAIFVVVVFAVALLAFLIWVIFQMMRQNGRILNRLDALDVGVKKTPDAQPPPAGLPVGTAAPAFALESVAGGTMSLADLLEAGKALLLVFGDPSCGPCAALLPEVARWDNQANGSFSLVLISRGTVEANQEKLSKHPIRRVLLQKDREVAETYKAEATPTAVLIHADGTIGSPVAAGEEAIRKLMVRAMNVSLAAMTVKQGDLAPVFTLPDLKGNMVASSTFQGEPSLLLFWNPGCGFCQRMLPDLTAWESKRAKDGVQLVLISTGSAVANRVYGLRSLILLDENSIIGRVFHANGTPTGVLLSADGRVASEVAIGAEAVFSLAHAQVAAVAGNA